MSPLLRYPTPSLLLPSLPVTRWGVGLFPILEELKEARQTIDELGVDAFGLAAPQLGVNLRLFIWRDETGADRVITNPRLLEADGLIHANEQCLSFLGQFDTLRNRWLPGLELQVPRYAQVKVAYEDEWGDEMQIEADDELGGSLSRMLQHEIDHLDGITFLDRVSPPVRKQAIKRFEKLHGISVPKSPRKVAA
jgi:peptide deformylase